jgi:methyl-accepting chemotaxis protein
MTKATIRLLRKSFARVETQQHVAALVFYQRLFELDPTLRLLFHTDIEVQSRKLVQMLAATVSLLDRPEELCATLEQLGARHVGYGVRDEHYETVGRALLEMLASVLGEDFTISTRKAWADLYAEIARAMKRGAVQVEHPPSFVAASW